MSTSPAYPSLLEPLLARLDALEAAVATLRPPPAPTGEAATLCPFDGVPYRDVPGYCDGYGCPVCKGIGPSHLTVTASDLRAAFARVIDEAARIAPAAVKEAEGLRAEVERLTIEAALSVELLWQAIGEPEGERPLLVMARQAGEKIRRIEEQMRTGQLHRAAEAGRLRQREDEWREATGCGDPSDAARLVKERAAAIARAEQAESDIDAIQSACDPHGAFDGSPLDLVRSIADELNAAWRAADVPVRGMVTLAEVVADQRAKRKEAEAALAASLAERDRLSEALANVEGERAQAEASEQRPAPPPSVDSRGFVKVAAVDREAARRVTLDAEGTAALHGETGETGETRERKRWQDALGLFTPEGAAQLIYAPCHEPSPCAKPCRCTTWKVLAETKPTPPPPGEVPRCDDCGRLTCDCDRRDLADGSTVPPGVVPVPAFPALSLRGYQAGAYGRGPNPRAEADVWANGAWIVTHSGYAPDEPTARRVVEELHRRVGAGVDPAALAEAYENECAAAMTAGPGSSFTNLIPWSAFTARDRAGTIEAMRRALATVGATVAPTTAPGGEVAVGKDGAK